MGSLVSIVVPTYNRAYCLERTLNSALEQTHRDIEVLLVDDGSSDDTRALIEYKFGAEPRLRYFYQPNAGVSAARNRGLREVRGDYVALLDSDDLWKPWKLEVQLACLRHFPQAGMIWTDMEAIDPNGKMFDPRFLRTMYSAYQWFGPQELFTESLPLAQVMTNAPPELAQAGVYLGDIYSPMIMGNLVHTSTALLTRERFEQVRSFDERLRYSGEDYDFHLRTCRAGPVAFLDASSIQYQKGMPDQLTRPDLAIYRAQNFLSTITPALVQDRARIKLPRHMLNWLLADTHAWIGESALDIADNPKARRHFARSLRFLPWQPRITALLLLALLPAGATARVRRAYAWLKQRIRPRAAAGAA